MITMIAPIFFSLICSILVHRDGLTPIRNIELFDVFSSRRNMKTFNLFELIGGKYKKCTELQQSLIAVTLK